MNIRFLAALMAAAALTACGFDATPQSTGSAGASGATPTSEPEKNSDAQKKAD